MRPFKVYGGWLIRGGFGSSSQVNAVVAARSGSEVMWLTGITGSHLNNFWCETGNQDDIAVAMSSPGTVFVRSNEYPRGAFVVDKKQPHFLDETF